MEKLFVRHGAVFAVVKAVKCRHKAYLIAVVRQAVDIIFVLAIMVEKRRKTAYLFQYHGGNIPNGGIDKGRGYGGIIRGGQC